ncbi:uncharacterized protein EI97DRAFT_128756 [Westerdykella ornata]|uniref:Uncharacterized protein n=1 Tax=Westerdykella ornata TaxID=318751 RepID=A0A6A6JFM3_WESOR|nr:uncharacterized protein EI97DRAFT_128756 [Westerdykella ornata]KAF2274426.1 hypothetical protein EI97DRAFT_128756 [Westerdykella ornata]
MHYDGHVAQFTREAYFSFSRYTLARPRRSTRYQLSGDEEPFSCQSAQLLAFQISDPRLFIVPTTARCLSHMRTRGSTTKLATMTSLLATNEAVLIADTRIMRIMIALDVSHSICLLMSFHCGKFTVYTGESPEPRRRQTYPEPRRYHGHVSDDLPSSQRRHRHKEDNDRGRSRYGDRFDDSEFSRRQHRREYDDYHRDQRSKPKRDRYDGRPPPEERRTIHDDRRRDRPTQSRRKESKWQKQAKDLFIAYAVPVIKTEGKKYVTKQLGKMFADKK